MSNPAIDYDAIAQQHGGSAVAGMDYDALARQSGGSAVVEAQSGKEEPGWLDREIPLSSHTNATLSGLQSVGRGVRDAVKGTYDTVVAAPQDDTEKSVAKYSGVGGLALYRMFRGIGHTAEDATQLVGAIHDINQGPDPLGSYAKAAQDTAGEGAGQALTALATEGVAKAVPKVTEAASDVPATKLTAPVRAAVKGANKVLAKAPGTIGAGVGAAAGAATHIPGAAEIGAGAGYALGREVLPQLKIPGEGFGLPNRVEGGPSQVEPPQPAAPTPESPAAAPPSAASPAAAPPVSRRVVIDPTTNAPEFSDVVSSKTGIPEEELPENPYQKYTPKDWKQFDKRLGKILDKLKDEPPGQEAAPSVPANDESLEPQLQEMLRQIRAKKAAAAQTATQ